MISVKPSKSFLLFFADFAPWLHHAIPGICSHRTVKLSSNAGSDKLRAGKGWKEDGWEDVEGGEAVVGEQDV